MQRVTHQHALIECGDQYEQKEHTPLAAALSTLLLMTARVFAIKETAARAIHIFIGLLGLAYLPVQLIKTFICTPIYAYWVFDVPGAKCLPQRKVFIADLCLASHMAASRVFGADLSVAPTLCRIEAGFLALDAFDSAQPAKQKREAPPPAQPV